MTQKTKKTKKTKNSLTIYPKCKKPTWFKVGVKCKCYGEGNDIFTVTIIGKNAAWLVKESGYDQGWESFTKLYKENHRQLKHRRRM